MKAEDINKSETKIMVVDRFNILQLTVTLVTFETVNEFVYLESLNRNSKSCEVEIKHRIRTAKVKQIECTKYGKVILS